MNDLLNDLENEIIQDLLHGGLEDFQYLIDNWELESMYQTRMKVIKSLNLKVEDFESNENAIAKIMIYAVTSLFADNETFYRQNGNIQHLNKDEAINIIVEAYRDLEQEENKRRLINQIVMFKNFMKLEE
ncbi:hypothetical protein [Staphylococcus ureilyticus]|uniref:hypothetical protein n=1 Tax=Staphylococcus ureilyticus TaxID=94138 RepID=UPI0021D11D17|nr:hypothetical protein [Staphylococcus ureilyticus]UXS60997.1 hypothetical protein MUA21_05215 [Staphylococcus ureilyticus]